VQWILSEQLIQFKGQLSHKLVFCDSYAVRYWPEGQLIKLHDVLSLDNT
jgi:hypothetical protein